MPSERTLADMGLEPTVIDRLRQVFARYPQIDQVILYGSRAKGNYRSGSDIDMTIVGDTLDPSRLGRIEEELDALLLPYRIDLSLLRQIEDGALIDHIKRVGIVFYERPNAASPG